MKKEVTFLPVAALYGHNIKERVPKEMCDWCETGSMFEVSYSHCTHGSSESLQYLRAYLGPFCPFYVNGSPPSFSLVALWLE